VKRGRALTRERWKALANANFDRDSLLWLSNVAAEILKADDIEGDDAARSAAVLHAVGLSGRNDPQREAIRAIVQGVDHSCKLIARGNRWAPARELARGEQSKMRREAVAHALGLPREELEDAALDKRIARALAN
jgi:hypothetical protein